AGVVHGEVGVVTIAVSADDAGQNHGLGGSRVGNALVTVTPSRSSISELVDDDGYRLIGADES
ncbi:MAG: hypothetical protein SXV54_12470, partial [Chloroflexota bacterium]|nr:hypothetical protein [Chloroflexota bacterium]